MAKKKSAKVKVKVKNPVKAVKGETLIETKTKLVMKHLLSKKTITSWEAIELYGNTRLSDSVYRIKKKKWVIGKKTIIMRGGKYAQYFLVSVPNAK